MLICTLLSGLLASSVLDGDDWALDFEFMCDVLCSICDMLSNCIFVGVVGEARWKRCNHKIVTNDCNMDRPAANQCIRILSNRWSVVIWVHTLKAHYSSEHQVYVQ